MNNNHHQNFLKTHQPPRITPSPSTLNIRPSQQLPTLSYPAQNWDTIIDIIRWRAIHQPYQTAFSILNNEGNIKESITFYELNEQAKQIGSYLVEKKHCGNRALLMYPSSIEFITALLGCFYANVTAVPIYPPKFNKSSPRLDAIIEDATPSACLCPENIIQKIHQKKELFPKLMDTHLVATDTELPPSQDHLLKLPYASELAFLQYTSGSTSTPKGVMVSHHNLMANAKQIQLNHNFTANDIAVYWLPNFHDFGLICGIIESIFTGYKTILFNPSTFIQRPLLWLEAMSTFKGSISGAPNFAYDLCLKKAKESDLSHIDLSEWRVAFNGAEPIQVETLKNFSKTFANNGFRASTFSPGYGLAESTLMVSGGYKVEEKDHLYKAPQNQITNAHEIQYPLANCGKVFADTNVKIVNPKTKIPCKPYEVGEIWIKSDSVAIGYWQNNTATITTFHAYTKDKEGPFLRSGDLGFLDPKQYLFITGRQKDLLIINGRNIYPQDIEITLLKHIPQLTQCIAVSIHINNIDQIVIVGELKRSEIKHLNPGPLFENMGHLIQEEFALSPYDMVLIKPLSLPKTSSGKVQRQACAQDYLNGQLSTITQSKDLIQSNDSPKETLTDIESLTLKICQDKLSAPHLSIHDQFSQFGGNSIQAIQIQAEIQETFGITISFETLFQAPSFKALASQINQQQLEEIAALASS